MRSNIEQRSRVSGVPRSVMRRGEDVRFERAPEQFADCLPARILSIACDQIGEAARAAPCQLIRLQITAIDTVKARLKARCLNYAIEIERQLGLQRRGQGFVEDLQNDVNNFFKARSEDVYLKLQKAAQLGASRDAEDFSLLLTEVRRALKAAADYFYPPVSGKVRCADGVERLLGDEQYLNRLQEFLSCRFARSTAKELMSAELDHLNAFLRRLNDMASKGVHAPVTLAESKQGVVGLYFFLSNLCRHLSQDGDLPSSEDGSV